ncbi:DUF1963 domain-containing protein [Rhizobium sp. XQZ8]|uniref:DUF1963 domain-containing protein n=1 Tax=Rhizobium populisoli TaxID=2859785 RepID=UPI001C66F3C8|nr:YwqG family protein [Rhizobium populisoli]MBW6422181.1 DUF1963 domain-containing protein [Rhizobium populisoli]
MFDTPLEAREFIEERVDADQVDMLVASLKPVISFSRKDVDRKGGSRIGGAPDLPPGMAWPRRPLPSNLDEIANRGNAEAAVEVKAHLAAGMPYAFFVQVDLAEAGALGSVAVPLPDHGRLLFFYDLIAGPYDTGAESARVIWDESPAETLIGQEMPDDLRAATTDHRREMNEIHARYGQGPETRDTNAPEPGTPYGGPTQPVAPKTALQLLPPFSLEFETTGALATTYTASSSENSDDEEFKMAYDELFYDLPDGNPPNQLLGAPVPVQDDPRYDAVVVTEFGKQHLSRDEWQKNRAAVFKKARDWQLLLQIDIPKWMQENGEGTVYFLIRRSDLEKRDFSRVVAVYQQT